MDKLIALLEGGKVSGNQANVQATPVASAMTATAIDNAAKKRTGAKKAEAKKPLEEKRAVKKAS